MAFNILKWILRKTDEDGDTSRGDFLNIGADALGPAGLEVYLLRLAVWACVRKIGQAVGAVEWETYRRGKPVKAREYWAWNYAPNPNQTRSAFFRQLVGQLVTEQEALVVDYHGARYVADSFTTEAHLAGDIYRDVMIRGETISTAYAARDVLHFTLEGAKVLPMLTALAETEGRLLSSAVSSYLRGNGIHGVLNIATLAEHDPDFDEVYADLVNDKFKRFFTSENSVLPLFEGYKFDELAGSKGSSKASLVGTRDIRNMMDDILELTAEALGVPPAIALGKSTTDADFKAFMTYSVQPVVQAIAQEINRKVYGQQLVFAGTYIVPNTAAVRYNDLFDVANPIDKLIGSGAFCINDIRVRLGLDVIDEPWARQHWMTKNYSTVEDLLTGVDGESTASPAAVAAPDDQDPPEENEETEEEENDGEE